MATKVSSDGGATELSSSWTTVLCLFLWRCPLAIRRAISHVVVYSVNAFTLRPFAHILKEVCEFIPSPTHPNSPCSVSKEFFRSWIGRSLKHVSPTFVRWCSNALPAVSVNKAAFQYGISLETSTRSCVPTFKTVIRNDHSFTARTHTHTMKSKMASSVPLGLGIPYYFYSSECLSNNTDFRKHNVGTINVVSSGGRSATTDARCDTFIAVCGGLVNA